jgi:transcriptional regulator with XRE-family HTH domain
MATFGELIQKCRVEADKTLDSVANLLGVSAAYVSEVELGKKPPFSRTRIEQLAAFYEVDSEPLLEQACRDLGFMEMDMTHVSSLQLKIISDLARGGLSEDQWAEIDCIVNRERWDGKRKFGGVLKLAALAKAAS